MLPSTHPSIKAISKNTLMFETSLLDISVGDAVALPGTESKTHDLSFYFILVFLTILASSLHATQCWGGCHI